MTDDFDMLDFDEPTVEFDFEVEVEVGTDAIDQNRNYEMKRSLHAWLCFHGGLFSEWGISCESVDEAARSSAQRMQDEGHYRWDSAYAARERAMMSLPTQLGSEVTPSPISFDVEGIRMGYNLPMSIEIEDTVLARFNERFPGKAGCGFATWSSFTSYYRNLASYLVYDLDRILVFLEDLLPDYMREPPLPPPVRSGRRRFLGARPHCRPGRSCKGAWPLGSRPRTDYDALRVEDPVPHCRVQVRSL